MLSALPGELEQRSRELMKLIGRTDAAVVASHSYAGSGANPARPLPSFAVAIPGGNPENDALRAARPHALFARVADGQVLLDARSLLTEDLGEVAEIVRSELS